MTTTREMRRSATDGALSSPAAWKQQALILLVVAFSFSRHAGGATVGAFVAVVNQQQQHRDGTFLLRQGRQEGCSIDRRDTSCRRRSDRPFYRILPRDSSRHRQKQSSTKLDVYHHPSVLFDSAVVAFGRNVVTSGYATFCSRWKMYSLIPLVAGFVGWFTNYLAVKMIFQPIRWTGLPIWRKEDEPLGLIGWQGIVPAKTMKMSEAMVNATITQLLSMEEMIARIDPSKVADILLPESTAILEPIVEDLLADHDSKYDLPRWIRAAILSLAKTESQWQQNVCYRFLETLTRGVQANVDQVLSLRNCVVEQMMADRYAAT